MTLDEFFEQMSDIEQHTDPLVMVINTDTNITYSVKSLEIEEHEDNSETIWIKVTEF